ncbi:MAG TPA: SPOR domain-containing protein [Gracilimonas sp.]|uniref:SPOR domain-containing protein n=1 Tax=Gracilimonas sp. TaxID=1974203 RepID=UPI002D8F0896|nr:SPOR domain-containing protein [Gracilimonas sp.]
MLKSWLTSIPSLLVLVVLCLGFQSTALQAQNNNSNDIEVYLDFRHRGVINSVVISYYKNDEFFLPVSELFTLFQIEHAVNGLIIDGNFGVEQIPYRINLEDNRIRFGDNIVPLTADDYLVKEIDSYLRADIFYKAFGLDFTIDFNNLSLNLETQRELPAIQQAIRQQRRQVADRNRLEQEQYPLKYDRERPFLDGGFMDYNLSANLNSSQNVYNFNTNLGIQLYGGDLQGAIFGSYSKNFSNFATDNLRWRYMYRDQPWLTKLTIGQTTTDGFSRNAYTGIRLTNEPIEPRRLFDEFEVQGTTIPQSEVELYLNNALIDFQQADELGNYRFLTPVSYGPSQLDLKIYGPTGQIIERSERLQVPFTFQPSGVFNYTVNAGRLDNPIFGQTTQDFTAQGSGAYGISEWLTAKAGVEYYQGYHESLPTFTASLSSRIKSNYILTLEAASEAYYRGLLNVIYPNSASFTLDYTSYNEGFSIYNPSNDEQRLVASAFYPFNFWGLPFNVRASAFKRTRASTSSTNFRLDLNSRINKLNLRVGYTDRFTGSFDPFNPSNTAYLETSATYNVSRNRNLPAYLRGVFLRGQFRYQPSMNQLESAEVLLSQNVFEQGRVQLSYGRNFAGEYNSLRFNLVIDFDNIRTSTTYGNIRGSGNLTQNLRGSIGYDTNYNNFIFTSRDQVGRSGAAVKLFVDNNADGDFGDEDDPIAGNALRIQRSGATSTVKNGVIYYTQMQPYFFYNMELNKSLIQNPMLVPEFEKFGLITDPNRFKKVEIPFYMSGVIGGMVEQQLQNGETRGVAGLRVLLTQTNGDFYKEMRTFSDGSFYDYEVPPGEYIVKVDSSQLDILSSKSVPEKLEFAVRPLPEGDFIEGLHLLLVPTDPALEQQAPITQVETQPDTTADAIVSPEDLADQVTADSLDQTQITETVPQDTLTTVDPELVTEAAIDTVQAGDNIDPEQLLPDTTLPSVPVVSPEALTDAQRDSLIETQTLQDSLDNVTQLTELEQISVDSALIIEPDTSQTLVFAPDSISIDTTITTPADEPIALTDPDSTTKDISGDPDDIIDGLPVVTPPVIPVPQITPTIADADGDSVNLAEQDSTGMIAIKPDSTGIDSSEIAAQETLADSLTTLPAEKDSLIGQQPINDKDPEDVIAIAPPQDQLPAPPDSISEEQTGVITQTLADISALPSAFSSTADIESLSPGRCIYGIQFASYFTEERSSTLSQKIEDDYLTFIIYNEPYELYAVREIRYQSLSNAGDVAKEINTDAYFDAAVVSQCYADLDLNPEIPKYYVQLNQFTDSDEASSFIAELNSSYAINAKLIAQNQQDLYIAVLGPFNTESQATEQLTVFDNVPAIKNSVVTRVSPPVKSINVGFEFMLLLEKFESVENANAFVEKNEDRLGENLKILIDENRSDYIVVSRMTNSWSQIQALKKEYSSSYGFEEPVILMIEKKR